jgi:hypothetical protein
VGCGLVLRIFVQQQEEMQLNLDKGMVPLVQINLAVASLCGIERLGASDAITTAIAFTVACIMTIACTIAAFGTPHFCSERQHVLFLF